jgi:septal ring factor EnvC (AmiA/AmiB activator)
MTLSPGTKATITLSSLAAAGAFIWAASAAFAGKADKAEISDMDKRIYAAERAQVRAEEQSKWILEDIKKANEKLDKILTALYFPPREPMNFQPPPSSPVPLPSPLNR